ncbi:Uncharacterised protein r2_g1283 [Pycnogonum litorale]
MLEIISTQAECPMYYVDVDSIVACRLVEKVKFCVLEIQEHFETYLEKKEHVIECLDGIKTRMKLTSIGGQVCQFAIEEQHIDLCKCLYKIHFQIVLLFESFSKLVTTVAIATKHNQVQDLWNEVKPLRLEILQGLQDAKNTHCPDQSSSNIESTTISRHDAEQTVVDLTDEKKWHALVQHIHVFRDMWPNDIFGTGSEDDLDVIMSLYCKHLCEKKSGVVIITERCHEPNEVCVRLMNANVHLSTIIRSLDRQSKHHHDRHDNAVRKTEC